jgi:hypothetical protein
MRGSARRTLGAPPFVARAAWVGAMALVAIGWATPARADGEAIARFERGVQLYEAENFEGALVEWSTAYQLSKNYRILYNIGICQTAQKDYTAAAESFNKYLAEAGSELSDGRKADVRDRLAKLSLMVTRVRITTDAPSGSTVLVDDHPVGTTPLADAITVKIGRRQFGVQAHGRTATKTVDVSSGDPNLTVALALGPEPTLAPTKVDRPAKAPVVAEPDGPSFPWPWWGLTTVLGGAAAVTGIFAVNAKNDMEEKQATFGVEKSTLEDERSKAQSLGIVTDALLVGAVLSAGLSTYFTVRYFGAKRQRTAITMLPMGVGYAGSF